MSPLADHSYSEFWKELATAVEAAFQTQDDWEDADLPTGEQVAFILNAIFDHMQTRIHHVTMEVYRPQREALKAALADMIALAEDGIAVQDRLPDDIERLAAAHTVLDEAPSS